MSAGFRYGVIIQALNHALEFFTEHAHARRKFVVRHVRSLERVDAFARGLASRLTAIRAHAARGPIRRVLDHSVTAHMRLSVSIKPSRSLIRAAAAAAVAASAAAVAA